MRAWGGVAGLLGADGPSAVSLVGLRRRDRASAEPLWQRHRARVQVAVVPRVLAGLADADGSAAQMLGALGCRALGGGVVHDPFALEAVHLQDVEFDGFADADRASVGGGAGLAGGGGDGGGPPPP